MSTADLLFDVSAFRYPEYPDGLRQLTEEATIDSFVLSFESLNNNVKLSRDQVRECWFYALHQEYGKVLSNTENLTREQIQGTDELLSLGIQQANTLQRHPIAEWEDADYNPDLKFNYKGQRQISKRANVTRPRKPQDYDPQLLLQSIPEMLLHAKQFYEDGIPKFLRKAKGRYDPVMVEKYKLDCACRAQEHVKYLLRVSYATKEKVEAGQMAKDEEKAPDSQPSRSRWEKQAKWKLVWTRMRTERKRIASELGDSPLIEHGMIIDTESSIPMGPSCLSGHDTNIRNQNKRHRRELRAVKHLQSTGGAEFSGVQDSVAEIEAGFKNLICAETNTELLLQDQEPVLKEIEMARPSQGQIFASMKRSRRLRKKVARREKVEKQIMAGQDDNTKPVSILSIREPYSVSTDDAGGMLYLQKPGKHEKRALHIGCKSDPTCKGTSPNASYGPAVKVEERSVPLMPTFSDQAGELERRSIKAETHNKPQVYEGDEMDIEMSGKIAGLEL